jgi:hypothetical protein
LDGDNVMATVLREVLHAFEKTRGPLSMNDMARDLDITPGMLEGMIDYWVRKGKIRECSGGSACASCGCAKSCAYSPNMPRRYELVTTDSAGTDRCRCR